MTIAHLRIIALLATMVTAGCQNRSQPVASSSGPTNIPPAKPTPATPAANTVTDQWLGKWIGPEGTYLVLSKNGDKYAVEINSLDGPATYEGTSAGDHIEFQRSGQIESIHAGTG